jgi:hypothetical protein
VINTMRRFSTTVVILAMALVGVQGCGKKEAGADPDAAKNAGKGPGPKEKGDKDQPAGKMTPAEARARLQSVNNLKQLALAMHSHNDSYKFLPRVSGEPGFGSAVKLTGLSWRTHVLSFIEQHPIYRKMVQDSLEGKGPMGWNRPDLAKLSIPQFAPPVPGKAKEAWDTYYRVFVGNGAAFDTDAPSEIPRSFRDGTGMTILIVEAGDPVPWPKPDELPYDPKKPLPKLGGLFADGFYAAFVDGTVRFIPRNIDEKLLRAMITRAGGEAIDPAQIPPEVNTKELERIAGVEKEPTGKQDKQPAPKQDKERVLKMDPEEAKARLQTVLDLNIMARASHTFNDATRDFGLPPASGEVFPKSPKLAGMSWRTYLLPYMEIDSNTVRERDVHQKLVDGKYPLAPGAHPSMVWNRPDLAKLTLYPFSSPVPRKTKEAWHTFYRVFVGNGAAFESMKRVRLDDFPDGLKNTILIVEAAEPVPWTKPEELAYDPKKPLPKLGGLFPDGFYAAFADASVHFIPRATDEKLIRAMITRNGGETIDNLPPIVDTKALRRAAGLKDPY